MQVNILEAKNRLSQLIKSVQAGEEVVIANRGEPVARLVPARETPGAASGTGGARAILDCLERHPLARPCAALCQGDQCCDRAGRTILGLIYLDACLLIYLTKRHARWGGPVADAHCERCRCALRHLAPLVKCECLVGGGEKSF